MYRLLFVLLGGLAADLPFDDRERAGDRLRQLWPVSAPPVLAGLYHPDAEVRVRCEAVLDRVAGGRWRTAKRVAEYPRVVAHLVGPEYANRPDSPIAEDVAYLELAAACGLVDPDRDEYARPWDARYVLWLRARAVLGGTSRAETFRLSGLELRWAGDR